MNLLTGASLLALAKSIYYITLSRTFLEARDCVKARVTRDSSGKRKVLFLGPRFSRVGASL